MTRGPERLSDLPLDPLQYQIFLLVDEPKQIVRRAAEGLRKSPKLICMGSSPTYFIALDGCK